MNPAWLLQRKHVEQKNSQKKKPAIFLNVLVGPMLASKGKNSAKIFENIDVPKPSCGATSFVKTKNWLPIWLSL